MYYTVYKITNQVNNKIYVGVHKTRNLDDSYMGSGLMLKRAITKHGLENFKKEYLAVFDNPDDMFNMESELVNEDFVKSTHSYNMKEGGHGGWDHISQTTRHAAQLKGARAIAHRIKTDPILRKQNSDRCKATTARSKEAGLYKGKKAFLGKSHSDSTRKKMSVSHQGKHDGSRNSQFGSMWITDRVSNKKISKDDPIPDGWMKGRT